MTKTTELQAQVDHYKAQRDALLDLLKEAGIEADINTGMEE